METRIQIIEQERPKNELLDEAIDIIELAVKEGHKFSNKQLDVFVEALIAKGLPADEWPWFREVAVTNRVPLWMMLLAQWRRAAEQATAVQLFLDPGWEDLALKD